MESLRETRWTICSKRGVSAQATTTFSRTFYPGSDNWYLAHRSAIMEAHVPPMWSRQPIFPQEAKETAKSWSHGSIGFQECTCRSAERPIDLPDAILQGKRKSAVSVGIELTLYAERLA